MAHVMDDNVVVHYPEKVAILNGSLSVDDYQITSYKWQQVSGPENIQLEGLDTPVLHVSHLHVKDHSPTIYQFILTVTDYRNLTNSTSARVTYYKG